MVIVEDDDTSPRPGSGDHLPQRRHGMCEPLDDTWGRDDIELPVNGELVHVTDDERQTGNPAMRSAGLCQQSRIGIDPDHLARWLHGRCHASRNRAGAAAHIEHPEARLQHLRQAPMRGRQGPGIQHAAGALGHLGSVLRRIIGPRHRVVSFACERSGDVVHSRGLLPDAWGSSCPETGQDIHSNALIRLAPRCS